MRCGPVWGAAVGKKDALLREMRVAGEAGGDAVKGPISSSRAISLWVLCCLPPALASMLMAGVEAEGEPVQEDGDLLSVKPSADARLSKGVRFILWFVGY